MSNSKRHQKGIPKGAAERPNLLAGKANLVQTIPDGLVTFNFKFLDSEQGQSVLDWEKEGLLSRAFQVFKDYSSQKISEAFSRRFKCYQQGFPPTGKTEFTHPKHVPDDALWASMHLDGKPCVIGHVYQNVFYVVFLDKDHRFYISDLSHT